MGGGGCEEDRKRHRERTRASFLSIRRLELRLRFKIRGSRVEIHDSRFKMVCTVTYKVPRTPTSLIDNTGLGLQ